jgi:exodeoxyribonuclease V beta subunit
VVRRAGFFYLVDWKSNTLPSYGPADVARSVAECDYVRQYRLYLQALDRWLSKRVRGYDRRQHLLGVLYLYVRGLSAELSEAGVYYHRPVRQDFDLSGVLRIGSVE